MPRGSRGVERRTVPPPREDRARPAPSPRTAVHGRAEHVLALQRLAGNTATAAALAMRRSTAAATPVRVLDAGAAAPSLTVQRDIEPGKPLPDMAAVGPARVRERLAAREAATRARAGYGAKLWATASDDDLVKRLITEREAFIDNLYRKSFTKKHPTDPTGVDQLVRAEIDKTTPTALEAALVQLGLLGLAGATPGLTAEEAKVASADFTHSEGERWLAGELIRSADVDNANAVQTGLTADAALEWRRVSTRPEGASFGQALSKADKAAFSTELRALPALDRVARAHAGDTTALTMTSSAGWADGGFLSDSIAEVNQNDDKLPVPAKDQYRKPIDDGTFRKTAFAADKMLRALVEPEVLGQLPKPQLKVHPMKQSKFRAFQSGSEVHLAADEPLPIVVHEVGHYLETHGAVESWVDIQRLLTKRHQLAGGGSNTVTGPSGIRKEGRYAGEYPATGKYTSKAYDSGDTEVMSMTLEYLARPATFQAMLEKDPVQAAVVLRAVQPRAYAARGGLRRFDKYLPS